MLPRPRRGTHGRVNRRWIMSLGEKRIRLKVADLIEECGAYARMAALFLAEEHQEEGDARSAMLWRRDAMVIAEMDDSPPLFQTKSRRRGHCSVN